MKFELSALLLLLPFAAAAQPPPAPAEQTVNLDPFEVKADSDSSYGALNSRSITSFNAQLDHLPVSADIFDQTFMNDVGATTIEGLMQTYSAGAGFSGLNGGASASTNQPGDRVSLAYPQLRGIMAPTIQRDGLLPVGTFGNPGGTSIGSTSDFDVERLEIIDGPQSLLYNGGGAGGVINVMSKQARIGQPSFGTILFRTDQYGTKYSQLDYGMSDDNFAARVALIDASDSTRRVSIGDKLKGAYAQFAYLYKNTTIRLTLEQTVDYRIDSDYLTLTSTSSDAAYFPYNAYSLGYLLATNQAGSIDNGHLNWDNLNSYQGNLSADSVVSEFATLTADTKWSDWLSTRVELGTSQFTDDFIMNTQAVALYSPLTTTNPIPGNWTMQTTGSFPGSDVVRPYRTNALRLSSVLTHTFFGGAAKSQTLFGGDYSDTHGAILPYAYYQADSNWNILYGGAVTNGGRYLLPAQSWTVNNGPVQYMVPFTPGEARFTLNGVNYVRAQQNPLNAALISPTNPEGTTIAGGSDTERNYAQNEGIYLVNYSQWLHDRLDTLTGVRLERAYTYTDLTTTAPYTPPTLIARTDGLEYNVGADYHVLSWLAPYASFSNGYLVPPDVTHDPDGNTVPPAHYIGEEAGLKLGSAAGTISGSLAAYHTAATNAEFQTTSTLATDINPSGLNGKEGALGEGYAANVVSTGLNATLTAAPTPNWRLRLSAAYTNGVYGTTLTAAQVYNDQFNENAAGQVTYADGTVVYVPATYNSKTPTEPAGTAGAIPLTAALISMPTSSYYANPNLTTGQISNSSAAAKVLETVDPVHGAILTGATGLPISDLQLITADIPGLTVPGLINIVKSGQVTTGYPELTANLTSVYAFSAGWLSGLKLGGTFGVAWRTREYYYYPDAIGTAGPNSPESLFSFPTLTHFDLILGYQHKLYRVVWSTQLNVYNLFNRYDVIIFPSQISGWTSISALRANFDQQPRQFAWTNSLSF